jgi:signal transduction histidine kinase
MSPAASSYRVSLRLWVVFSLLMAASATASGLLLLFLARPFIALLSSAQAADAGVLLFTGAGVAGAMAAVAGLTVGIRFAGRIRGIVRKAEMLAPAGSGAPVQSVRDELGALDAAVGRLTLSMDQFVRDSDILARLPEGMLLVSPAGYLTSFNNTAQLLLGLPLERFRGTSLLGPSGLFPMGPDNEALARLLEQAAGAPSPVHVDEVSLATAAGQALLLEMTLARHEWRLDSRALVLLFRDASEKQRIREEIRRADQLALIGGMAARVAHEIRTPLATIRGLLELMQTDLPQEGPSREYTVRILQAIDRQNRLVEDLLTLSNPEPEAWQEVSVASVLEDVVGMLPNDRRLRVDCPRGLPSVWGDEFRLAQVFTNLVKNALEAAPPAGTVDVSVEAPEPGRVVRVRVRNTGAGIPGEMRERIFQPFFTTKARGTGLGLSIARQIVAAHRGSLTVWSDGVGETAFAVELPTAAPGPALGAVSARKERDGGHQA